MKGKPNENKAKKNKMEIKLASIKLYMIVYLICDSLFVSFLDNDDAGIVQYNYYAHD